MKEIIQIKNYEDFNTSKSLFRGIFKLIYNKFPNLPVYRVLVSVDNYLLAIDLPEYSPDGYLHYGTKRLKLDLHSLLEDDEFCVETFD